MFRLSSFILSHLPFTLILITIFILSAYTTVLVYNHYKNISNINNTNINTNIDSVVSATYDKKIEITTTTPILPRNEILVSRGGITTRNVNKSIIEPVVINKVIEDKKVDKVEDKKVDLIEKDKVTDKDFAFVDSFIGTITKYTLAYEECLKHSWDKDFGITASGAKVKTNHTIAMNRNIPFGTIVKIEGFDNVFTVSDRGGAIIGLKIDVYVESRNEAFKWGVQKKKVWILKLGSGKVE